MAKPRKTWVYAPAKPKASEVPAALRADLGAKARRLIEEDLKPKYLEPPPADDRFNYIADLYGRWYRHYFYFWTTRCSGRSGYSSRNTAVHGFFSVASCGPTIRRISTSPCISNVIRSESLARASQTRSVPCTRLTRRPG